MYRRGIYTRRAGVAIMGWIGNGPVMERDVQPMQTAKIPDLETFLRNGEKVLQAGPVALVFAEDGTALGATLQHHLDKGFRTVVLLGTAALNVPDDLAKQIVRVDFRPSGRASVADAVTRLSAKAPGVWFYWCFNAEFLFYPHAETRTIGELLAFHAEERRDAMMTYVVDLYAGDLNTAQSGVALEDAYLDRTGYYALDRSDAQGARLERQYDIYGGLRWRFEEFVPEQSRRIDRIGLFRAKPGLVLRDDFTFSDDEYNTISCEWHHNLTAAACSFRAAKALKTNPGSKNNIQSFRWQNSIKFEWTSEQLLQLGFMETGQWF